jgi:predicted ABC-type exoprotein transport system permease subunit
MKFLADWHFWVVLFTVLVATIPQLSSYLPHAVVVIALVLLGAAIVVINTYEKADAFTKGVLTGTGKST